MTRPPTRAITAITMSLGLLLGGACVAGEPRPATESAAPPMRYAPGILPADQPNGPLYGTTWQPATTASTLSRLDPRTLLPVAGTRRLRVDGLAPWTVAPDRSVAVFGPGDASATDPGGARPNDASVYVMDLEHMRQVAVIKAKAEVGFPRAALWLGAGRVLLLGGLDNYQVVERAGLTSMETRPALVATIVDVTSRRVIAQRRYIPGGEAVAVEPTRDGIVVLLQPTDRIDTVAVGRVDTRAELHLVRLGRVTAGFQRAPDGGDVGSRQIVPGLAVDTRGRAYVVAAGSPVAEIALARMSVRYHSLITPGRAAPSVLGMLRRATVPAAAPAAAKSQSGPERHVLWLGDGRLAVWGTDMDFSGADGAVTGGARPSGLKVIDTRDWSVRTLDPTAGRLVRAEDKLVTAGVTVRATAGEGDAAGDGDRLTTGDGLRIRAPGTRRPVHVFAGRPVEWIQAYGRYVYLDLTDPNKPTAGPAGYAVIDTRTGAVLGEHQGRQLPTLLK
jgi:hypothetical protein